MAYVLIVYYSRHQHTKKMAKLIARGVEQTGLLESRIRSIPPLPRFGQASVDIPDDDVPYVTLEDLEHASALAVGSPGHFGNTSAPLANFIGATSGLWLSGALKDKPFSVFTSTSSLHGGQETTLLTMAMPWLHHGMVLVGLPFTLPELSTTTKGGTPYGASTVTGKGDEPLSGEEKVLCLAAGERLATVASKLMD